MLPTKFCGLYEIAESVNLRMSKPLTCLILNLLVAMALLLTACSYSPTTPPQTTPENGFKGTVLIGGIFDLSGASAVEGREYAAGILAYNSRFNS